MQCNVGIVAGIGSALVLVACSLSTVETQTSQPQVGCGTWDGHGYVHAWEVGQANGGGDYDENTPPTERVLTVGAHPAQGPSKNSDQAVASLTLTSSCNMSPPSVTPQLHLQLGGKGQIETHIHINDEAGVAWRPQWISSVSLPALGAHKRYLIDVAVDYTSYLRGRTCAIQVGSSPWVPVKVFYPPEASYDVHARFVASPGVYPIQYLCGPAENAKAYFIWEMGHHVNDARQETVQLAVSLSLLTDNQPQDGSAIVVPPPSPQ